MAFRQETARVAQLMQQREAEMQCATKQLAAAHAAALQEAQRQAAATTAADPTQARLAQAKVSLLQAKQEVEAALQEAKRQAAASICGVSVKTQLTQAQVVVLQAKQAVEKAEQVYKQNEEKAQQLSAPLHAELKEVYAACNRMMANSSIPLAQRNIARIQYLERVNVIIARFPTRDSHSIVRDAERYDTELKAARSRLLQAEHTLRNITQQEAQNERVQKQQQLKLSYKSKKQQQRYKNNKK